MKSLIKKILLFLFAALVAIQFFPAKKNTSTFLVGANDITVLHPTSAAVKTILAQSCYDCHSDNTEYPWYTRIQPVGWWMQDHVDEGRSELNFSQFGTYSTKRAQHKLDEIIEEIREGEMPLTSYLITHREAKLTESERQLLADWISTIQTRLTSPLSP